jgi:hypothetical protein
MEWKNHYIYVCIINYFTELSCCLGIHKTRGRSGLTPEQNKVGSEQSQHDLIRSCQNRLLVWRIRLPPTSFFLGVKCIKTRSLKKHMNTSQYGDWFQDFCGCKDEATLYIFHLFEGWRAKASTLEYGDWFNHFAGVQVEPTLYRTNFFFERHRVQHRHTQAHTHD